MRRTGRSTKVPGIEFLGNGRYRIRARAKDRETGRMIERDRVVEASSVEEAVILKVKLAREMNVGVPISAEKEAGAVAAATVPDRRTFRDFATSWLRGRWPKLAPSTRERYVGALDDHILPALGDIYLDALSREDIEALRDHRRFKEKQASATVNGYLRLIRVIMARATRELRLPYNPALDVDMLPEDDARISDEDPNALEPEELRRLLEATKAYWPQHYPMLLTLVTTGMRMGAVRALHVDDLDPGRGIIHVRRRVSGKKSEVVPGVKRGRKAKDEVPLHPEVHRVLTEHVARFNEAQKKSGLLFPTPDGRLHADSVLRKPFRDIVKRAGITKRFTPHGCRRTANDFFRRVTSEVVTRAITGHVTHRMHEHYSTVTAGEKLTAAEKAFGDLLGPARPSEAAKDTAPPSKVGDQWGTERGTQWFGQEKGSSNLLN